MNTKFSGRIAAGTLALGIGVGVIGIGSVGAFATTAPKLVSGTISSVSTKTDKVVVKVGKKSDTFKTDSKTVVDLGGKKSSLANLKAGDKATVDYTVSGKTWTATTIDATA